MTYANVSTEDLKRRYRQLDENTSAVTMEQEIRRMSVLDQMGEELGKRGVDVCTV